MSKKTLSDAEKTSGRPDVRHYGSRFILDLFMFSTLMNGIACSSGEMLANDQKSFFFSRRIEDGCDKFYHVVLRAHDRGGHNGHTLSAGAVFDKMLSWLFDCKRDKSADVKKRDDPKSFGFGQRFVGHRKRLQFALLPIMYKMGVMTTLLMGLTVFALKSLAIGLILLMFTFGNHFFKHGKPWSQSSQPIHVHVHPQEKPNKYVKYQNDDYGGEVGPWDREEVQEQYSKPYAQDGWESYRKKYLPRSTDELDQNDFS